MVCYVLIQIIAIKIFAICDTKFLYDLTIFRDIEKILEFFHISVSPKLIFTVH